MLYPLPSRARGPRRCRVPRSCKPHRGFRRPVTLGTIHEQASFSLAVPGSLVGSRAFFCAGFTIPIQSGLGRPGLSWWIKIEDWSSESRFLGVASAVKTRNMGVRVEVAANEPFEVAIRRFRRLVREDNRLVDPRWQKPDRHRYEKPSILGRRRRWVEAANRIRPFIPNDLDPMTWYFTCEVRPRRLWRNPRPAKRRRDGRRWMPRGRSEHPRDG